MGWSGNLEMSNNRKLLLYHCHSSDPMGSMPIPPEEWRGEISRMVTVVGGVFL